MPTAPIRENRKRGIIQNNEKENRFCEKGYRNKPLTEEQKSNNTKKSSFHSRVEHIFGFMEMSMNEMYIQCMGVKRVTATIELMNLKYNIFCKIQLETIK
jgi:hypothetical protein